MPALFRVTRHVLALHDRVLAREPEAIAEVEALDELLRSESPQRPGGTRA
jgi:hypothetical protein